MYYTPFDARDRCSGDSRRSDARMEADAPRFETCREALIDKHSDAACLSAAQATAAFAGMHGRITAWLDDLGVASWLDIESTEALFESRPRSGSHDIFDPLSRVRRR